MRTFILALALGLAACGQTATPPAPEPAAQTAESPAPAAPTGEPMVTGLMGGMSTTASNDVSALTVNRDGLAFTNDVGEETFSVPTAFIGVLEPSALIAAGGESFAVAAPSSTATRVEVRRLTAASPEALCGGMAATHVAIVSTEPLTGLQLMVFTGADAPGPAARDSAICAIYAYLVD